LFRRQLLCLTALHYCGVVKGYPQSQFYSWFWLFMNNLQTHAACFYGCAILLASSCFASAAEPDSPPKYAPLSQYEDREIEGWPVRIHRDLLKQKQLSARTLREAAVQLYRIKRVVQPARVAQLQKVRIWIELYEPHHKCMAYHPGARWLTDNDMHPDKAKCVELANANTFLQWTLDQPWMLLHELAHAYHDQFLPQGYENATVLRTFNAATSGDRYGEVDHIRGGRRQHYAATNQMEYFAEATEAYFGVNDYFPYVRHELKKYDPAAFDMLQKVWGGRLNK